MTARPLRKVPIHDLRPNHTSWTPPSVFSFDTETISTYEADKEIMTMRLWCARFTDRRAPRRITPIDDADHGMFADDLAIWIHKLCKQRRTIWGYAHNLGFDLCTSSLIDHLIAMQWEVTEFAVNSGSPFVRLRNKESSLTLSDSWSWFGVPLEKVADELGMRKPPLPRPGDTQAEWLARCTADADILHTAMLTLMEWWDNEDLGRWNLTGSASGWNAMRHIATPQTILIRPDDDECDHDRTAIYGGRRQTWISGDRKYGRYTEVDFEKAYTTVCRELPLPVGRQARFTSLPTDHKWLDCRRWGVVASVEVNTDVPRVPCRVLNSVWYPVGQFRTSLAGPDIKELREFGALVSIGAGWLHRLGYALKPWATWCIASLSDEDTKTPGVAKLVHRQWARSAIGKWGQRGFEVVPIGPSPTPGWDYEEAWHHGKNVPAGIVDFAGQRYQVAAVNQSDNAYPAILAFVESYVRVALSRAISVTGDKHMLACDTDGYLCDNLGADRIELCNQATYPLRLRAKRHFRRVTVIGPQHLELDQIKRRSGIPSSATPGPDGKLHAKTWPKLAWQIANGRPGAYVRPEQTYRLAATYAPGWVLSDGSVVAVELSIDAAGNNQVVAFPDTRYGRAGLTLGPHQNRHLKGYTGDEDQARNRAHHQATPTGMEASNWPPYRPAP